MPREVVLRAIHEPQDWRHASLQGGRIDMKLAIVLATLVLLVCALAGNAKGTHVQHFGAVQWFSVYGGWHGIR